jgi:cytochrome o ubiquinol oxidase subunit 2
MNGMATQLNLSASKPGIYQGLSSHYSGDGFSDMHFDVRALPPDGFAGWVATTRNGGAALTAQSYAELARQSLRVAPFTYNAVDADLFSKVVTQALPPGPGPARQTNPGAPTTAEN